LGIAYLEWREYQREAAQRRRADRIVSKCLETANADLAKCYLAITCCSLSDSCKEVAEKIGTLEGYK